MTLDKPIIILSHARAGSTWFQESIKMFSMGEFFCYPGRNLPLTYDKGNFILEWNDIQSRSNDEELGARLDVLSKYQQCQPLHTIKINSTYLYRADRLENIIVSKKELFSNYQYVYLERQDKFAVFLSHIRAKALNQWRGNYAPNVITISKQNAANALARLSDIENNRQRIMDEFNPEVFYYEKMLSTASLDWFNTESTNVIKQNGKDLIIDNYDDVINWFNQKSILA